MPDGYCGSGKAWQAVARRHRAALAWRIVARVDGDNDRLIAAERRAIQLARSLFGQGCLNVHEGGDGFTPEQARAQAARNYARPEYLEKLRAARLALSADPAWREGIASRNRARGKDPEFRRKVSEGNKGRAKSPAHKAKIGEVNRAPEKRLAQKVTAKAQLVRPRAGGEDASRYPQVAGAAAGREGTCSAPLQADVPEPRRNGVACAKPRARWNHSTQGARM